MTSKDQRDTSVKREDVKDSVRNALWARTAGRCTICNRRLLGDSRTYMHSVLLAELAHNVGAVGGARSPRGSAKNGSIDTEAEENLLLLCHDCHRIIDHPDHIDLFPPEKLREIKETFERRIEMVTENGGLTRTAALRVGSMIRGSLAMASQREVAETLLAVNYLGLVETQRSGDFTCRINGAAGDRGYWDAGQQSIEDTLNLVQQAVVSGDVEHISVFAIAPIPLLVYLGWHLDDKTPTRIFQKHRDQFVGWSWAGQAEPVDFEVSATAPQDGVRDVVLVCAITSEVNLDRLPDEIADAPRVEIRPAGVAPGATLMSHEQSLINFATQWRAALATAESQYLGAKRWHLVVSGPVTVAIEAGRAIMRDAVGAENLIRPGQGLRPATGWMPSTALRSADAGRTGKATGRGEEKACPHFTGWSPATAEAVCDTAAVGGKKSGARGTSPASLWLVIASALMLHPHGAGPGSVEVPGGTLSYRLPTEGRCGSHLACLLVGHGGGEWLKRGLLCSK